MRNFGEALVEYWQEEDPVLAIKNEVERFNSEVDLLKEKFSQLEARSDRLINGNDI